jgi:kynurenine formamidase
MLIESINCNDFFSLLIFSPFLYHRFMLDRFRIVDLTHYLDENAPTWSGGCGFRLEIKLDYEQGLRVQSVKSHAGVGTHMDAPSHFIEGSWNIGDIPLEQLIVPACVLKIEGTADLFIEPSDIARYERQWGSIPEKALFIASTGWELRWGDPVRYRNPDSEGRMRFPGFSAAAADYLLEKDISGVGIDTLSPDGSNNKKFPVHEKILGAKKYILENLANLGAMPPSGAYVIVFPPKARHATESACRAAGLIPI